MTTAAPMASTPMAVYVSNADSADVSVLALDPATAALHEIERVAVGGQAMPMALAADRARLYVGLRSQPYRVVTFAIDSLTGRLTKRAESSLADSMAHLSVDRSGRWLFAASYGGDTVTVNAIDAEGVVGAVVQRIATPPHAHAVQVDVENRTLVATSLGGDALMVWHFDAATGAVLAHDTEPRVAFDAGSGPRHFRWDAAGRRLYLLCELDGALHVCDYDAATGTIRRKQRASVLPAGFTAKPWAAELQVSPDGRFLYASERTSSTIAVFAIDAATGALEARGSVVTETTPRGFAIDPSGRVLVAAGQDSHAVSSYAIDAVSGALVPKAHVTVGCNPNWVEIVALDG
jgi:6-phosphogluconolactonase